jgi:hypothetical protein
MDGTRVKRKYAKRRQLQRGFARRLRGGLGLHAGARLA